MMIDFAAYERALRAPDRDPPLTEAQVQKVLRWARRGGRFDSMEDLEALLFSDDADGGNVVVSKYSASVKTNATELTRLAEAECIKRGDKPTDFAAMKEATKIVLSRDPKLARAYFDRPHDAPTAEGDDE